MLAFKINILKREIYRLIHQFLIIIITIIKAIKLIQFVFGIQL